MQETIQESEELTPEEELSVIGSEEDSEGVEVSLDEWEKVDCGTVRVWFWLPTGERISEDMDWPVLGKDGDEFKFVRLLQDAGLSMDMTDFDHASDVTALRVNNEWLLDTPEHTSFGEQIKESIDKKFREFNSLSEDSYTEVETKMDVIGFFLLFSVIAPFTLIISILQTIDEDSNKYGGFFYLVGTFSTLLWAGAIAMLLGLI